jgi:hypothetical protein
MKAELIYLDKRELSENCIIEAVDWRVPTAVPGSQHAFKYRLAYVEDDICRLRYDNERGKGDHRHIDGEESQYIFVSVEKLFADFLAEIERLRA